MRWTGIALVVALAACGESDPDSAVDAMEGACDAAPVELCVDNECLEGYCVRYHTESGFPSCNDYDACVQVMLACTPGVCDPDWTSSGARGAERKLTGHPRRQVA